MRRGESKKAYPYLIASSISIGVVLFSWYTNSSLGQTTIFLFFILSVVISNYFGGISAGLATSFSVGVVASYFYLISKTFLSVEWFTTLYEISLLLVTMLLISFVIEKYKKTDVAAHYYRKEKNFREHLKKLEDENSAMQKEIQVRDEFLSIASHELKTPLTSMLLKLQLVLHNVRNVSLANFSVANLLKMLETAELQTKRLSKMINDLLNVSLITTGKMNLELSTANLSETVKEVVSEFSEKLDKEGYEVKLGIDKDVVCVMDKLRIELVLTNLISNAIKYGNSKPIEIHVAKNHRNAHISIIDHGIGIASDQKERVFALFERGVSDSDYKGLGVGLFIANQIIKAHQGKIELESRLHKGSTFIVELPLQQK